MIPKGTYNLYTRELIEISHRKNQPRNKSTTQKKSTKKDINHAKKSIKESMKLNEAS
jgi:hypothetical protein